MQNPPQEELTTEEKIGYVANSKELCDAAKLLYAAMKDCNLNQFIRVGFEIEDEQFELTFTKVQKENYA